MSKPRMVEMLERELRPYVGARAEFIARRMAPGVTVELLLLTDEAIRRMRQIPPRKKEGKISAHQD